MDINKHSETNVELLIVRFLHYRRLLEDEATEMMQQFRNETHNQHWSENLTTCPDVWEKHTLETNIEEASRIQLILASHKEQIAVGMFVWKKATNYNEIMRILKQLELTLKLFPPQGNNDDKTSSSERNESESET